MRGRRARLTLVLALLATFVLSPGATAAGAAGNSADADFDESLAAQLQGILDDYRTVRPVLGLAATVTLADGSRWEAGSGLAASAEGSAAFGTGTPSVIGSITKTFVAALILQLAESGALSLDDLLSKWFPKYAFASRISVRQLLAHTSGLRDYFTQRGYKTLVFGRPTHRWTRKEILALVGERLLFAPGTSWSYSNTNYLFLGMIAERVTGRGLGAELRARFWQPLGMAGTYFQGRDVLPADAAHGYLRVNGAWSGLADGSNFRPHTSAATVAWAVGNVLSTASDVATWTRALYSGNVLTAESLALMLTFNDRRYGLGAREFSVGDATAVGHTGSLRGYTAITWYLPAHGFTVSVLTNRGRINPEVIANELGQAVISWQSGAAHELRPAA